MKKEIKKNSPDYDDEQLNATVGEIWYNRMSAKKRKKYDKKYRG